MATTIRRIKLKKVILDDIKDNHYFEFKNCLYLKLFNFKSQKTELCRCYNLSEDEEQALCKHIAVIECEKIEISYNVFE